MLGFFFFFFLLYFNPFLNSDSVNTTAFGVKKKNSRTFFETRCLFWGFKDDEPTVGIQDICKSDQG